MFATAPSEGSRKQNKEQDIGASTVSLPTLSINNDLDDGPIKSRRMSQQKKMNEYFTNKRKLLKNRY